MRIYIDVSSFTAQHKSITSLTNDRVRIRLGQQYSHLWTVTSCKIC